MLCLLSYFTSSLRRLGGTEDVAVRSPGRKDDRLASPEIRPAARRPCSCAIGATHRRPGQRPGGTTLPNQKRLTAGITDVRRLPKGSGEMTCPVRAQMRMWTQAPGRCPGLRWGHPLRGEKDKAPSMTAWANPHFSVTESPSLWGIEITRFPCPRRLPQCRPGGLRRTLILYGRETSRRPPHRPAA